MLNCFYKFPSFIYMTRELSSMPHYIELFSKYAPEPKVKEDNKFDLDNPKFLSKLFDKMLTILHSIIDDINKQEGMIDHKFPVLNFEAQDNIKHMNNNIKKVSEKFIYLQYLLKVYPEYKRKLENLFNMKMSSLYAKGDRIYTDLFELIAYIKNNHSDELPFIFIPEPPKTFEERIYDELRFLISQVDIQREGIDKLFISQFVPNLVWNGSQADLMELSYALKESGKVTNSTYKDIYEAFSYIFNTKINNPSLSIARMVERKHKHINKNKTQSHLLLQLMESFDSYLEKRE